MNKINKMPSGKYIRTEKMRRDMSLVKKGKSNGRLGKHHSKETIEKLRKSHMGKLEENASHWKGDKVGYSGVHHWIRSHKPKPQFCEFCKKNYFRLTCANLSGEYKRDINDFKWLCYSCHKKMDLKNGKRV